MAPPMAWWGSSMAWWDALGPSWSRQGFLGVIFEHFEMIFGAIWCHFWSYFFKFFGTLSDVFIAEILARFCRRNACMDVPRERCAVLTA